MTGKFSEGYAFIVEGETDRLFYERLMEFLCTKHSAELKIMANDFDDAYVYNIVSDTGTSILLIKVFYSVSTIATKTKNWFNMARNRYGIDAKWTVFLCYDLDEYFSGKESDGKHEPGSGVFNKDSWKALRSILQASADVVELAAVADIEDVFLCDLNGVCNYVKDNNPSQVGVCNIPRPWEGNKGKRKMARLFDENHMDYRSAKVAQKLLEYLNIETIIEKSVVPLNKVERIVFEHNL